MTGAGRGGGGISSHVKALMAYKRIIYLAFSDPHQGTADRDFSLYFTHKCVPVFQIHV